MVSALCGVIQYTGTLRMGAVGASIPLAIFYPSVKEIDKKVYIYIIYMYNSIFDDTNKICHLLIRKFFQRGLIICTE